MTPQEVSETVARHLADPNRVFAFKMEASHDTDK